LTLFTLCPTGTIFSVACVKLSDVFMHSRVPHCTTFGAICGIMGVFVGWLVGTRGTQFISLWMYLALYVAPNGKFHHIGVDRWGQFGS
jgi:hypothetical protein